MDEAPQTFSSFSHRRYPVHDRFRQPLQISHLQRTNLFLFARCSSREERSSDQLEPAVPWPLSVVPKIACMSAQRVRRVTLHPWNRPTDPLLPNALVLATMPTQ